MGAKDNDSSKDGGSHSKLADSGKMLGVRTQVARELVSTESAYCNAIHSISTEFLYPIQAEGLLKREHIDAIFANIDQIGDLHMSVLADLEKCIADWTDESKIGETFMRLVPYLKLYKQYCANYHGSLHRVEDRRENSSKFAAFLSAKAEQGFDLPSLLIRPIQRIPRYRLLFAELLKHTPPEHADYQPTSAALLQIEDIAIYVNEAIREKENQDKLLRIQQSLVGSKIPEIVNLRRKFIREGVLVKMCRREPKRRYFFLFNDMLLYGTANESVNSKITYQYHRALGLDKFRVDDIIDPSNTENNAFQVLSNQKSFTVYAESEEEKIAWMTDINKAIQLNYQLKHGKGKSGESTDGESIAPVWVPDKLLKNCMVCEVKFTAINRRHHCRKCGKLLCGGCSSKKFKLENLGKVSRVCDGCYEELSSGGKRTLPASQGSSSFMIQSEEASSLARRATKKFNRSGTESKPNTGAGSFLPAENRPSSLHVQTENSADPRLGVKKTSSSKDTRQTRKKVKKKKSSKSRRSRTGTLRKGSVSGRNADDSDESSSDYMDDFDMPLPNFGLPAPPIDEDPFLDFNSSESSECINYPLGDAPLAPKY